MCKDIAKVVVTPRKGNDSGNSSKPGELKKKPHKSTKYNGKRDPKSSTEKLDPGSVCVCVDTGDNPARYIPLAFGFATVGSMFFLRSCSVNPLSLQLFVQSSVFAALGSILFLCRCSFNHLSLQLAVQSSGAGSHCEVHARKIAF